MFKPVDLKVDFPAMERRILEWWYSSGLVKKYLQKNNPSSAEASSSKKKFSFFDGPITANNPMGVHHAWGRTYKDLWQRYKNMQGFRQRFQNGFDCQGLWVEVEVEKDLGFNSKKDIEKFGLDNFSKACRERVDKYSKVQTEQSKRLGYFMDWDNSYYTFTDKNIEYIWYFLKECYKKGWLYKGFRSLPWCTRCGTSLSQHELTDSYKEMTHKSVFLKLPIIGRENEFFLVWTTTPWTLAANVALAVNPSLNYMKVKIGNELLILAKDLLKVLKGKYKVIEEFKGSKLEGLKYKGPFDELPAQKDSQRVVLLWEEVSGVEGTGIVHIAPGCGEEDFDLGKKYKLKVLVPLDENGNYVKEYGDFTGKFAHKVGDEVFASLEKKDLLYKIEDFTHSYPICWRCKEPIVFRAEENWFISATEIRPKMIREARKVKWHPEYVGKLMENWLENMGDWNISRKRYFGLPLPFYECQCGEVVIAGSLAELKRLGVDPKKVDNLPELHRPWIDEVEIKCPKCGKQVKRIPDIGDCWLDAGIIPFSTLKYLEDKKYWQFWFPADWISEMREQVRLWFYSTLFMGVTLADRTPYLEVLSYEKLNDEKGQPMHKSAGNTIWFEDAAEKMGADVMRWMYALQKPELNINFGYGIADEVRRRFHLMLWNVYNFFVNYANIAGFKGSEVQRCNDAEIKRGKESKMQSILDKWITSRLNGLIKKVTESLDKYDAFIASHAIEDFVVNDLSAWYVRRSRDRVSPSADNKADKDDCLETLYSVLVTLTKMLAPFTPFLAEEIYQNLVGERDKDAKMQTIVPSPGRGRCKDEDHGPEDIRPSSVEGPWSRVKQSVHLEEWPKFSERLIDKKLEEEMVVVRKVCELGHAVRKAQGIKVRQPLKKFLISNFILRQAQDDAEQSPTPNGAGQSRSIKFQMSNELLNLIKDELNVKEVVTKEGKGELEVEFDMKLTPDLKDEGEAREVIRQIQEARKENGCQLDEIVEAGLPSWPENFTDLIKKETLAKILFKSSKVEIKRNQ